MKQELTLLNKEDLKLVLQDLIKETLEQVLSQGERQEQTFELLITREEAARMLHISLVTLNQWVKDKRIPAPKKIGNRVFFLRQQFIDFVNQK